MGFKRLRRNAGRVAKSLVDAPVGQEQPLAR